jgi:DNA-binding MarR family transcriptional regulator
MDKSDALIKDEVLRYTLSKKGQGINPKFLRGDLNMELSKAVLICEELECDGLIARNKSDNDESFGRGSIFGIKPKGEEFILNKGGFTKLYETQDIERKRLLANQVIEDDKLRWDAKLSKWQVKTFWYVFFGGFIVGAIALVLELEGRYSKWQEVQSEQSLPEQIETSANSTDKPKEAEQYLYVDTLK